MKKAFSWFFTGYFILGSLAPNTDFAQLWHAAFAIQHFHLHQDEASARGQDCSLWSFIEDHYLNPDGHSHDDGSDHENLPIHHLHAGLDLAVQPFRYTGLAGPVPASEEPIGFLNISYSFLFNRGVDRPPSC
ncbi:MAG: hypothetical protein HKN76_10625 [Saprospiraceae bacterium]|nr:hypothetical protein [Saprospiraceae bacterium]